MTGKWLVIKSFVSPGGTPAREAQVRLFEDKGDASQHYDQLLKGICDDMPDDCRWVDLFLERREVSKNPRTGEVYPGISHCPVRHHRGDKDEDGKVRVNEFLNLLKV